MGVYRSPFECKKINKETQQFIAGDLLQFHWMLMKVFAKRDLYGGLLNLLLGKENIPIVNVSVGKNGKVGGSSTSLKTWAHERSTMVTAKLERMDACESQFRLFGSAAKNIDCLKNMAKPKTPVQWENLLGVWISRQNQKRRCCVEEHSTMVTAKLERDGLM